MCQWQRYERRVVVGSVAVGRGRAIWSEDIWPYWRAREQAYTTDRNQECQECKMSWGYWHWHSKAEWFGIAMKPKQSYQSKWAVGPLAPNALTSHWTSQSQVSEREDALLPDSLTSKAAAAADPEAFWRWYVTAGESFLGWETREGLWLLMSWQICLLQ